MARDNGYGILLDFEFESFASVNEKFEKIVDKLKENAEINFSTNGGDFSNITKELETLKKEFNKLQNVKINIDTTGSHTQIEQLKNASNEILNIVKKYNTEGELTSVSSSMTRQNNELVAQKDIYNKLNALQEDEFRIKTKLLNASKEETTILKSRLSLNQGLQKEGSTFLSNNNLTDEKQYNELLTRRKDLEYELSLVQAKATNKYNTNVEKERIKYQKDYVNTWKDLLNEQDKAENKLKEIAKYNLDAKVKMQNILYNKKDNGLLYGSSLIKLQKQIDNINVNTPKERIDSLLNSINNIGKSEDKIVKLTTLINEAKETISRIKSESTDFLNTEENNAKIKILEENIEKAVNVLHKAKKNSFNIDSTNYKNTINNLGFSTNEINKEINNIDRVKDKLKEIQDIQLKMTQSLNVKKSQGWLNNSTYTNIQKQIDKINVDTPKSKIQDLFKTINNIDKSSSKVYELSNYINNAKETISRVKSDNSDFLNIDGSVEKIKQLEEYLKQAESMLNKLKKNNLSVDNISYKDIKNNLGSSTDEINKIEKENNVVKDLIETKTRLLEIEKSRVVRTYGDKIDTSSIDEAIKKLKSMNSQPLSNVKSEIKGIDLGLKELKESARSSESFISKMGKSLNSFGLYLDIGDVVRELGQAFKQTIDVVIDMDSALSDLNKVCNYSSQQLEYMKQSAISMGKQLGKSVTEIVNAQAEIGKAYKKEDDINTLTRASTIGANVMDGLTSDQVAKGLTTVITAMDKQVSDSMNILDSMNEVKILCLLV